MAARWRIIAAGYAAGLVPGAPLRQEARAVVAPSSETGSLRKTPPSLPRRGDREEDLRRHGCLRHLSGMTDIGEAKPPRVARRKRSRRRADDAGLLDPLAPPDTFAPLATERLILRPLVPEDAEALHRLVNDWEVTRNLAVVPFPYPRKLADNWILSTRRSLAEGRGYQLAITGREGEHETMVGVVGLRIDRTARCGRLGYWVGRRFWGHGVASEAAGRLARWALANLDLDRLEAGVITDNPASAAVLRRIGFRQTGEGTDSFLARGGEHAVWRFEATRDDIFGHAEPARREDGRCQADAAGRRLCADRSRWPRAAGAPAGGQEDGRAVGIPRRQAAPRRDTRKPR